jgi:hypothetical protein
MIRITELSGSNGGVARLSSDLVQMSRRTVERAAAYQRKIEQSSMLSESSDRPSPAGTPPFTHPRYSRGGRKIRAFPDFIYFNLEGTRTDPSAVVGPVARWAEKIGHTHEFGGTVEETASVRYGKGITPKINLFTKGGRKAFNWRLLKHTQYKNGNRKFIVAYMATYPKRPFARPALEKTAAKMLLMGFK